MGVWGLDGWVGVVGGGGFLIRRPCAPFNPVLPRSCSSILDTNSCFFPFFCRELLKMLSSPSPRRCRAPGPCVSSCPGSMVTEMIAPSHVLFLTQVHKPLKRLCGGQMWDKCAHYLQLVVIVIWGLLKSWHIKVLHLAVSVPDPLLPSQVKLLYHALCSRICLFLFLDRLCKS